MSIKVKLFSRNINKISLIYDWEQRKLGEVVERVQGNDGRVDLPTLTISAGNGWLDQRERFSKNIAGKEQKNYTLLSKGNLSYNKGNSKLAKYGVVFELKSYKEALVPKVYHSFKPTYESRSDFLEYMFATKIPDNELAKLITSGARMDGLLNIGFESFIGIKMHIPSLPEQTSIGTFFRTIDDSITLHKRKLDLLKQIKQGYLQQMFPKNGENVPRLRFANFEGDWIKRKLGKILYEFSKKSKVENQHVLLSSTNLGMEFRTGRVSGSSNIGYKIINNGDLVLSPQNLWLGNININNIGCGLVSPSYKIFKIIDVDLDFLKPQLRMQKMLENYKNVSTQGASIVRRNLEIESFNEITIKVPCNYEQFEVGDFFVSIDHITNLYQQKEYQLLLQKRVYLQMMFI